MGLKKFLKNCLRVLRIATKPSREEYRNATKITGLGIIAIGLIGFAIFLLFKVLGLFE